MKIRKVNNMDSLLKIESLKKYYGKKPNQTKALDGISFQVMPGSSLASWVAVDRESPHC